MSLYLFQAAYTSESWKHQVQQQESPSDRIKPIIEGLGGHIVGTFYSFGEYDLVVLAEMPSDEAAAAFALAVNAGGSTKAFKTTSLMTIEQGLDAMKKAAKAGKMYHAPVSAGVMKETVRT